MSRENPGLICTFYSYKGGVGRSMAMANVGLGLAMDGKRVLLVDWDLEAPGLERYFVDLAPYIIEERTKTPGILDLLVTSKATVPWNWRECVIEISFQDHFLSLLTAGQNSPDYAQKLQELNWDALFSEAKLGVTLEKLRQEWVSEFDFILIDSRTGVTDVGNICTIHLPDALILFFTTNEQSLGGIVEIARRARKQQERLPFERGRLLAVPVTARDESQTEVELSREWRKKAASETEELFRDWLPKDYSAESALESLRIPHVPFWTFGEKLAVIASDPSGLGPAYSFLARLIANHFDWERTYKIGFEHRARSGAVTEKSRQKVRWNSEWLRRQKRQAGRAGQRAFMEVTFAASRTAKIRDVAVLLEQAKDAQIETFGWPIGVVLDSPDLKPRPTAEGIFAEVPTSAGMYDYWALRLDGSFYLLRTLFEDRHESYPAGSILFFDTRVIQVAEVFLYCVRLLTRLEIPLSSVVRIEITHSGLAGRSLSAANPKRRLTMMDRAPSVETTISTEVEEVLGQVEDRLPDLVERICSPLFALFDFATFQKSIYEDIVGKFKRGLVG